MIRLTRRNNVWKSSKTGKRHASFRIGVEYDKSDAEHAASLIEPIGSIFPGFELDRSSDCLLPGLIAFLVKQVECQARVAISGWIDKYQITVDKYHIDYPSFSQIESYITATKTADLLSRLRNEGNQHLSTLIEATLAEVKRRYPAETHFRLFDHCVEAEVPVLRHYIGVPHHYSYGTGARQFALLNCHSDVTSHLGSRFATNKTIASEILAKNLLPVPAQKKINSVESALAASSCR